MAPTNRTRRNSSPSEPNRGDYLRCLSCSSKYARWGSIRLTVSGTASFSSSDVMVSGTMENIIFGSINQLTQFHRLLLGLRFSEFSNKNNKNHKQWRTLATNKLTENTFLGHYNNLFTHIHAQDCVRLWSIAMCCKLRMTSFIACKTTQYFTVVHIQDELLKSYASICVK